nr:hypothetical protein [uncultured Sphingomonas sp.]
MVELNIEEIESVDGASMTEVYVTGAAVLIGCAIGGPALGASVLLHAVIISALD